MKHLIFALLLLGSLRSPAQAPYTITLQKAANQPAGAPALQSFCIATLGSYWLLIGGRTNGFHGTSGSGSTFPTSSSNTKFWVIDMASGKTWSAPVPTNNLYYPLSATNIPYYQDGNTLYLIGGYGAGCAPDSCYQTFQQVTAIDVQNTIKAVINGTSFTNYIKTTNDNRLAVTGGYLTKLGGSFMLVMGQDYRGKYSGGVTGKYTEKVYRFTIDNSGPQPVIGSFATVSTNQQYNGINQFHRRDYPAVTTVNPRDRSIATAVFAGVFNKQGGPFVNPVYLTPYGFGANALIDTFTQRFSMYDCAAVSLYNPAVSESYVSFIGGITDWTIDAQGHEVPGNAANFMPWFNRVSTIVRTMAGTSEYPQTTTTLPGYIGANAAFIINPSVVLYGGTTEVIDFSRLPTGKSLIGWMYGGIESQAQQSSGLYPTVASSTVYEVWLQKN